MQTDMLGEGSFNSGRVFNDRSNTNPCYQQWMQIETEVA